MSTRLALAGGVLATASALVAGLAIGSWLERWRIRDHQPWEPPIPLPRDQLLDAALAIEALHPERTYRYGWRDGPDGPSIVMGYTDTPAWPARDYGPGRAPGMGWEPPTRPRGSVR